MTYMKTERDDVVAQTASEKNAGIVASVIPNQKICARSLIGAENGLFLYVKMYPLVWFGSIFYKKSGPAAQKDNRPTLFFKNN